MTPRRFCLLLGMPPSTCPKASGCFLFRLSGSCKGQIPCSRPLPHPKRPHRSLRVPAGCQTAVQCFGVDCLFSDGKSLALSRFLGSFIRSSDQIEFDPAAVDSPRAFGAARLLRLALRAERPRVKTEVAAYAASAGTGSSDSSLPSGSRAGGSIDTRSAVTRV